MSKLKSLLQKPERSRFISALQKSEVDKGIVLLATLPRSGTHYTRALIVNLLNISRGLPLQYVDEVSSKNSSVFERDFFNAKPLLGKSCFSGTLVENKALPLHICRTHQPFNKAMAVAKIINLYRKPESFFESYLVYMYVKRGENPTNARIYELIDRHFPYYELMISSYDQSRCDLALDFDELMNFPLSVIQKLSQVLEVAPPSESSVGQILEICSIKKTQDREQMNAKVNVDSRPLNGSFINNKKFRLLDDGHKQFIRERTKKSRALRGHNNLLC